MSRFVGLELKMYVYKIQDGCEEIEVLNRIMFDKECLFRSEYKCVCLNRSNHDEQLSQYTWPFFQWGETRCITR